MYLEIATGLLSLPNTMIPLGSMMSGFIRNDHVATTSSAVMGVPSLHLASGLMRNLYVFLSSEMCQCVATRGMNSLVIG